jgi:sec-independent protein translocase protein TatB
VGNIGPEKLMLLFLVALIVLGPARLPEAARTIGKVVGELRRLSGDFQSEMRDAIFDPVTGARDALLPSAWGSETTPPPLASPAADNASAAVNGEAAAPSAPAGRGPGSALPLPDDPNLN